MKRSGSVNVLVKNDSVKDVSQYEAGVFSGSEIRVCVGGGGACQTQGR